MARISIKDIAKALGVSGAAVSLVLNGKEKEGRIGKEMADKIRQKAKEMNYEPNNLARGLRVGRSQTIGLIVADISNLFFANLAFHIQEHAEKNGYSVIITNTNESDRKMEKMIQILKSRQVDGFIIVPTESGEKSIQNMLESSTPLVLLDRYFPMMDVSRVVVDNYQASAKATDYLVRRGCKNIGLIIYKNKLPHMLERRRGYEEILMRSGLFRPELVREIEYLHMERDVESAIEMLLGKEANVDGIFFATNTISISGIKHMLRNNIRIFDEVNVICFDKSDAFDLMQISIPFVQQPIPEMGRAAVDLLISQIKKESLAPIHVELMSSLQNTSG